MFLIVCFLISYFYIVFFCNSYNLFYLFCIKLFFT